MNPCVVNVRAAFKQAPLLSRLVSNLVLEKEEEEEEEKEQWSALSGHKTHASDISYISKGSNLLVTQDVAPTLIIHKWHVRETRRSSSFSRQIPRPQGVAPELIKHFRICWGRSPAKILEVTLMRPIHGNL